MARAGAQKVTEVQVCSTALTLVRVRRYRGVADHPRKIREWKMDTNTLLVIVLVVLLLGGGGFFYRGRA